MHRLSLWIKRNSHIPPSGEYSGGRKKREAGGGVQLCHLAYRYLNLSFFVKSGRRRVFHGGTPGFARRALFDKDVSMCETLCEKWA